MSLDCKIMYSAVLLDGQTSANAHKIQVPKVRMIAVNVLREIAREDDA